MTLLDKVGKFVARRLQKRANVHWKHEYAATAFNASWPWSWRTDWEWTRPFLEAKLLYYRMRAVKRGF